MMDAAPSLDPTEVRRALEAILFVADEPLSAAVLAQRSCGSWPGTTRIAGPGSF